ncbi:MAG TPA: hypothetical protein VF518_01620 [Polyangia bacterium]
MISPTTQAQIREEITEVLRLVKSMEVIDNPEQDRLQRIAFRVATAVSELLSAHVVDEHGRCSLCGRKGCPVLDVVGRVYAEAWMATGGPTPESLSSSQPVNVVGVRRWFPRERPIPDPRGGAG